MSPYTMDKSIVGLLVFFAFLEADFEVFWSVFDKKIY